MPQGDFTQSTFILLDRPPDLDEVAAVLASFEILKKVEDPGTPWYFGGPSLVIPYRSEQNGFVYVDIVGHPWPDSMGHPTHDSDLFGAWASGQFGPHVVPGALVRASRMSLIWRPEADLLDDHTAFVRVRTSYVFGQEEGADPIPADHDPVHELEFVMSITKKLMDLPGSICYFNPNGELLRDAEALNAQLGWCAANKVPSMPAWTSARLFEARVDRPDSTQAEDRSEEALEPDATDNWWLLDTVGLPQVDLPDLEAFFPAGVVDPGPLHDFLWDVAFHLIGEGHGFEDGDTLPGPADRRWRVRVMENSWFPPLRRILRWFPVDELVPEDFEKDLAPDHRFHPQPS